MHRDTHQPSQQIHQREPVAGATGLCLGCGGLPALHLFRESLGPNVVFVHAAGCLSVLAAETPSPSASPWLCAPAAAAAAGAQGVRDALDVLLAAGRLAKHQDFKVVVVGGDGVAHGNALQAMRAAIQRRLDFFVFCYDTQGYPHGSGEMSRARPPVHAPSLFDLWHALRPAFIATVSPAFPVDLMDKVARAGRVVGPKLFVSLAPCPPRWGVEPAQAAALARLAVDTGVWPLKEARDGGGVEHTVVPHALRPVDEYLRPQARYHHLFEPQRRETVLHRLQADVDRYWIQARAEARRAGQAATHRQPAGSTRAE